MSDLKWTKNDFNNALATVSMMGIPEENIIRHVDKSFIELKDFDRDFIEKITQHAKNDENVFVYAYAVGHGVADIR